MKIQFVSFLQSRLKDPSQKKLSKGEYHAYKLRTNPTDSTSPTYELSVPFFSTDTPEEYLKFKKNLDSVATGQVLTDGPKKYALARRLLQGDALTTFEAKATAVGTETVPHFNECLQAVATSVFPTRAMLKQKRYMRRMLRKTKETKTRDWAARAYEMNNYIEDFPEQNATKLSDEEMKELLEHSRGQYQNLSISASVWKTTKILTRILQKNQAPRTVLVSEDATAVPKTRAIPTR